MQLPPAPKLFLSPGRGHPFIWGLQIKQVSWLINLTDRAYCGQCQPKRKPHCLLSRWLTFLLFFDSLLYNGSHRANLVIDLKKTGSSRQVIEYLKQKLCLFSKRPQYISGSWTFWLGFWCLVMCMKSNLLQETFSLLPRKLLQPVVKSEQSLSECLCAHVTLL